MGMTESTVFDMASAALEQALSEGRFSPGSKGWKRAQAEVMRVFLTTPLHSLDERTPRTAVWDERQESWAERPGRPFRQALVGDLRERIRAMPDAPARSRDHFLPLLRILEIAATNPPLTQAGYPSARDRSTAGWRLRMVAMGQADAKRSGRATDHDTEGVRE